MSGVRILVGTRKGAFVLTSDGKRQAWDVSGPHFAGWEIYHLKGSPADPNRIYASQSSGWFGQLIQRSNDGGKTWEPVGNKFAYDGMPGTHQWYDGTPHPWEFKRVWHLEPSLTDPDDGLRRRRGRRALPTRPTAGRTGTSWRACAATAPGSNMGAGRRRSVPAHDPAGPEQPEADLHRDLRGRRVPDRRRRRRRWTPINKGLRSSADSGSGRRGGPLRPPHRDAPVAAGRALHAEALGRHAERQRRRLSGAR